jgi:hypothetical protein
MAMSQPTSDGLLIALTAATDESAVLKVVDFSFLEAGIETILNANSSKKLSLIPDIEELIAKGLEIISEAFESVESYRELLDTLQGLHSNCEFDYFKAMLMFEPNADNGEPIDDANSDVSTAN